MNIVRITDVLLILERSLQVIAIMYIAYRLFWYRPEPADVNDPVRTRQAATARLHAWAAIGLLGATTLATVQHDVLAPLRNTQAYATHTLIDVFFATDREDVQPGSGRFTETPDRSGQLHLGVCQVSIPRDPRHKTGNIERPSIWRFEFHEDPESHFVIATRAYTSYDAFYDQLAKTIASSGQKQALIFVHGFNVPFDDAIYRTAQIAYDIGFDGAPILYSWPATAYYARAVGNAERSVEHFIWFLRDVRRRSGARVVNVIAHSMGNQVIAQALRLMNGRREFSGVRLHHLVLTAPDIDATTFGQLADAVKRSADKVTLYVSSKDLALKASKDIYGGPRVGDSDGDVTVIDGIDTIDATAVDTNLIGHFYYGENRSVLSDVFALFHYDAQLPRFGVTPFANAGKQYWIFRP